ncbi:putative signal sequence-binding GTPase GPN3 ASCRUDRAFT_75774 [Ascoidea rubescens DSM 1968]|uniref:GPN-loop GTPase 3 n=1 Tax=Ascoidea rubescens DSM 1968 TaxID=1344418 RepID=A0A1D2VHA3_9ASCO|nr:hypothetical protein ASCRUDRAFT_75774 [Ascoidea rubescens DSM 1968]ODV61034.1 hypothetical protein ASCRUDRAFT_75774 [Ascoidea rubescens DSM 1968]
MSRVGVLALGPAGAGKSTFCNSLVGHMQSNKRSCCLINLDPAAEQTEYEFSIDIRDLISLKDVMEELQLGPNGGLIYCFEFLLENLDWLDEEIGDFEEDYLIIDCPGQIELYTHIPILPRIIEHLRDNLNYSLCITYLMESSFIIDNLKFLSGTLSAMSTMILLELPHINLLSKFDLVKNEYSRNYIRKFLQPDPMSLMSTSSVSSNSLSEMIEKGEGEEKGKGKGKYNYNEKFERLNLAIGNLIEDFGMVQFLPLECKDKDSIANILSYVDDITQWAENQEPKEPKDEIEDVTED